MTVEIQYNNMCRFVVEDEDSSLALPLKTYRIDVKVSCK